MERKDRCEYFLVEYRDRTWSDTSGRGRINWDASLPNSGVAVWHVDETVGNDSPTWPFTDIGQGQNDSPSRFPAVPHALVALIKADGKFSLEDGRPDDLQRLLGVTRATLSGKRDLRAFERRSVFDLDRQRRFPFVTDLGVIAEHADEIDFGPGFYKRRNEAPGDAA